MGSVTGGDGVCKSIPRRGNSMCEGFWQEEAWECVWSMVEGYVICKAQCKIKMWIPF